MVFGALSIVLLGILRRRPTRSLGTSGILKEHFFYQLDSMTYLLSDSFGLDCCYFI